MVTGWRAELFFGTSEIIVAAKHLINDHNIRPAPMRTVSYHHILFDQHELVWSDGCISESFFPGDTILSGDAELYDEMTTLFPELASADVDQSLKTARPVIRGFEARALQGA